MNDEQLQKELEEALAIEPTPHFLARVRREVETGKQRSAARVKWASATAGMAAVAVAIGHYVARTQQTHNPGVHDASRSGSAVACSRDSDAPSFAESDAETHDLLMPAVIPQSRRF
jgi:hypothetical protein